MLPISSLDLSLACFCEPLGESPASVNQLRKTGGRAHTKLRYKQKHESDNRPDRSERTFHWLSGP